MNLTRRKLLAIFSLELFLYSLVYVPVAFVILLATIISTPSGTFQKTVLTTLAYGPPLVVLAVNGLIAAHLVRKAPFSERNWRTMRFGLKLLVLQFALVLLTFVSGELNVVVGFLAAAGLVAAAVMESEPA